MLSRLHTSNDLHPQMKILNTVSYPLNWYTALNEKQKFILCKQPIYYPLCSFRSMGATRLVLVIRPAHKKSYFLNVCSHYLKLYSELSHGVLV